MNYIATGLVAVFISAVVDAWTAAMKGEVKQNTAESVEEWLKLYEASKKKQARG